MLLPAKRFFLCVIKTFSILLKNNTLVSRCFIGWRGHCWVPGWFSENRHDISMKSTWTRYLTQLLKICQKTLFKGFSEEAVVVTLTDCILCPLFPLFWPSFLALCKPKKVGWGKRLQAGLVFCRWTGEVGSWEVGWSLRRTEWLTVALCGFLATTLGLPGGWLLLPSSALPLVVTSGNISHRVLDGCPCLSLEAH